MRQRKAGFPAERAPTGPTRSGRGCRGEVQQQILDKRIRFYTDRCVRGGAPDRHGRPDQHDHANPASSRSAGVLPRDQAIARSRHAIEQDLRASAARSREAQLRGGRCDALAHLREVPSTARSTRPRPPRGVRRWRPTSSSGSRPRSIAGKGDRCRSARCRWTDCRSGRRSGRSGTSPTRSRSGTRHLHPVQSMRARLSTRRDPGEGVRRPAGGAPAVQSVARTGVRRAARHIITIQVAPEDCTGCDLCVDVCPAKDQTKPGTRRSTCVPYPPLLDGEREN